MHDTIFWLSFGFASLIEILLYSMFISPPSRTNPGSLEDYCTVVAFVLGAGPIAFAIINCIGLALLLSAIFILLTNRTEAPAEIQQEGPR